MQEIKDAAPDGHTIGIVSTSLFALMPALTPPTRYKAEDLDYLGTIGTIEYALVVGKDAPYDDLAGIAAFAKKSGAVTFSATGKVLELTMERLAQHFDFKFVSGPTSGSAQSLQLVLGGHAHATISGGVHVPYIETGKAKSIASLSSVRADYAPNARTLQEQGAGRRLGRRVLHGLLAEKSPGGGEGRAGGRARCRGELARGHGASREDL